MPIKKKIWAAIATYALTGCGGEHHPPNSAPVISQVPDMTCQEGDSISSDLSSFISDPDGDRLEVIVKSGPGKVYGMTFSYQDHEDLDHLDNEYRVVIEASDRRGGMAEQAFFVRQMDKNHHPVILPIPGQTCREGRSISFGLSDCVTDPDGDPMDLSVLVGPGSFCGMIYFFSDVQDDDTKDDVHNVTFLARDTFGGSSQGSFTIIQKDVSPRIIIPESVYLGRLSGLSLDSNLNGVSDSIKIAIQGGKPIIIYSDDSKNLSCLYPSGTAWRSELVKEGFGGRYDRSLAVKDDISHLSAAGPGTGEALYYLRKRPGENWSCELVDGAPSTGLSSDISADSAGNVFISYWDWGRKRLKFATDVTGRFVAHDLCDATYWTQTSIALDESENPLIAYRTGSGLYVLDPFRAVQELVVPLQECPLANAPVLKPGMRLAFQDDKNIFFAMKNGSWDIEEIAQFDTTAEIGGHYGRRLSMEIHSGAAFIPFTGTDRLSLLENSSGEWKAHILGYGSFRDPAIALDSVGRVHIAAESEKILYISFTLDEILR